MRGRRNDGAGELVLTFFSFSLCNYSIHGGMFLSSAQIEFGSGGLTESYGSV